MAIISLLALLLCIVLSFIKKINTGVIGFALAFLVGVYLVGMSPNEVIKGFPTSMVFTLMGSCSSLESHRPTARWAN